jgi:hypothetical protein
MEKRGAERQYISGFIRCLIEISPVKLALFLFSCSVLPHLSPQQSARMVQFRTEIVFLCFEPKDISRGFWT